MTTRIVLSLMICCGAGGLALMGCSNKSGNEPASKPDDIPPMPKGGPQMGGAADAGTIQKGEGAPKIELK